MESYQSLVSRGVFTTSFFFKPIQLTCNELIVNLLYLKIVAPDPSLFLAVGQKQLESIGIRMYSVIA